MVSATDTEKVRAQRVLAGKASARSRWGEAPARVVRLDRLEPFTAQLVRALVRAEADAKAAAKSEAVAIDPTAPEAA